MERELRDAIRAGAMGFTTSRSPIHETPDGRPVASRLAAWDEIRRLVGVMVEMNAGIFELAGEAVGRELSDSAAFRAYHERLRDLAVETRRPVTFGNFSRLEARDVWRHYMSLLDETAAADGRMFAQVHSRGLDVLLSFKTQMPFDNLPAWKPFRALPLAEQRAGPDTIAPEMHEVAHDLPAGARRLVQRARGIAATVVNGEILLRDGKHTGALPGRLLRGPLARRP
jgi:hypothetical protein